MRNSRFFPAAMLAVVLSALAGGFYGSSVLATQDDVLQHYRIFTSALGVVEREYVEEVPADRLVYGAIEGMLHTLDPHSAFFNPREYEQMRERQQGTYYGLGIQIQSLDGDITVMSVFENSPAYRKGLRRGDIIALITGDDGETVSAKGFTPEQAVRLLKGPKGTTVGIAIKRRGYDGLIDMRIERDEVNIVTVRGAFMIDGQTGYIKLGEFSETSDREMGAALEQLTAKGMTRLLFDLRDNPGGALDQAIRIANRFLPRGDLIVYTRGRVDNADQQFRATERSEYVELPVVVLVNRNSASASEIVSGALQDHDRGIVVGETTFGKALVQSVYRVAEGAGVAVTTGRYYTPSGRMIQRPWDGSFDEYLSYSLRDQREDAERPASEMRLTDSGRKVYGGGGIQPDKFIVGPVEGFNPTRFGRLLYARQAFVDFAGRFRAEGDTRLGDANKGRRPLAPGFTVTDAMVDEFKTFLATLRIKVDEESFQADRDFITAMIHFEIDRELFGIDEARRNLIARDPQAQFALGQFSEAHRMTELTRARIAQGRR
jgi:carboxyl-terminal processing protease